MSALPTGPRILRLHPRRHAVHPATLSALVDALDERASALHCGHDRRKAFTEDYARHAELVEAMRRAGVFGPATPWIERLMLEHAGHYFRALDAWDAGDMSLTPAPWRAVFSRPRFDELPDSELSRLCAVVHTSYDLPLALARCPFAGMDPVDVRRAWDRIPAFVVTDGPVPKHGPPWRRRPITSDVAMRAQAWDDGMRLLEAPTSDDVRAAFVRMETRVLLRVAV
jgi:hypothetical protein